MVPIIGGLIYLKNLHHGDIEDMFEVVSDGYGLNVQVIKEIYDKDAGKLNLGKIKNNI
jgi:hypothetical protein